MGRNILAAVAGYILLSVVLIVLFSVTFMVMGVDWSFKAGSYEASGAWVTIMILFSIGVAVLGGYVAQAIAKNDMGVKILAGIVLVMGLITAIIEMNTERAMEVRPDDVPLMEAMMKGIQPIWLTFLNPIIGVVGVLFGGRLKAGSQGPAE